MNETMTDRRQPSERRSKRQRRRRDRRRKGDQRVFAIELGSEELRVAVLHRSGVEQGADEVTSAAYAWRKSSATLASSEGQAELAAALREAAVELNMFGAEVRVVLQGELCIIRTIRGTLEEVRAELQQLEQRSRLYLSLGPGEKALVSTTRSLDARHAVALAAVCNRATLEAIQSASGAAGIEIAVIEPALTALNRAVKRLPNLPDEPYLLVQINRGSMEIGVCHDGQLLVDYRPGGRSGLVDLRALMSGHLNRLSRHVGRHLRMAAPTLHHVFLCGSDADMTAALSELQLLPGATPCVVRAADVKATWQFGDESADAATPGALGALLASYLPAGDVDAPNLMQHLIDRKREPLRPKLVRSALPLAATLLAAITLVLVGARQQCGMDAMQAEIDSLAVAEGRANELRLQIAADRSKLAQLGMLASQLPSEIGDELVVQLAQCMPGDVWLRRVEINDRERIRIEGASYLEAGVYDFVRWLEAAPGVREVALKGTQTTSSNSGPATSFELDVTLDEFDDEVKKVARHE
jgi:hypothetical protein